MRSCLVATALARKLDLSEADVVDVFYVALLQHVGCSGYAHETYLVWTDDIAANRAAQRTNFADTKELFTAYLPTLLRDANPLRRAQIAARFLPRGPSFLKRFARASCEVAEHTARRLGLSNATQVSLRQYSEWWDGKGVPAGVAGDELILAGRVVHVASVAAKFDALGGPELAVDAVTRRAGSIFDPSIAATFVTHARELLAAAAHGDPRQQVLEVEPDPARRVPEARLVEVAAIFGDLTDLKTPFTHGHSAGVARLARAAGQSLRLDSVGLMRLEVAGFLHDLGRNAISNAVWEKRGPLTSADWEQVRLHPYHSERILSRSPLLEPLAPLVGMHHERIDGSGYYRGCSGAQLPVPARILAAADGLQAMTQSRPHRNAFALEEAVEALADDAAAGRLDADATRAVIDAAGATPPRRASYRPAGLSEREVEVLRLVARGLSNREIARRLHVSPRTAEHHVRHIYTKIGVSSRAGAALFGMEHGLLF